MKQVAEINAPGGQVVRVELATTESGGLDQVSRGGLIRIQRELVDVLKDVRPVLDAIVASVNGLTRTPDTIEAKVGFSLSASGNMIVASGTATSNFELRVTWKP
jgi:hypothetical protein